MSNKPIIEITGLGKKYPIVHDKLPYSTLRDSIVNFIKHPFSSRKTRESFWALKDINLTINRGDIIGIIGKNGAGKSTLLKILSGITKPTEGKVKLYGRVSSLLEVGTGFHPELTGRENIYLNGVILGMTRKEVSKKFDEIVAFAGIEKFLDTPVKHYSSGMYVRLAFAVAAHLEPDILIVDEVLAVGDIEFQKKCLGKMEEVSKEEGRTVIFVSHNLDVIEKICKKTVYIEDGRIKELGNSTEIVNCYMNDLLQKTAPNKVASCRDITMLPISIINEGSKSQSSLQIDHSFYIEVDYIINQYLNQVIFCLIFYADSNIIYVATDGDENGKLKDYKPGKYRSTIKIPAFFFNVGIYKIVANIQKPGFEYLNSTEVYFRIIDTEKNLKSLMFGGKNYGYIATPIPISTQSI